MAHQPQQQQQQFAVVGGGEMGTFPPLKWPVILDCLHQMNYPLTLQQCLKPDAEQLKTIWEDIVKTQKGVSMSELKQLDFHGVTIFEYPDLHEESLSEMGLLAELLTLFRALNVTDVTISDFTEPTEPRLRKLFSALINYVRRTEETYKPIFEAKIQEVAIQQQESQQIIAQLEELEGRRAQLVKEDAETIQPELDRLLPQKKELEETLAQKIKEYQQTVEENAATKEEYHSIKENVIAKEKELNGLTESVAKLRSQIIPDPEGLNQELKDMTNLMHTQRSQITAQIAKTKAAQARSTQLNKLKDRVKQRVGLLRTLRDELKMVTGEIANKLQSQSEQITQQNDRVKELAEEEASLNQKIEHTQHKLLELEKNLAMKRITAQHAIQLVQGEKDELEKQLLVQRSQSEQNEQLMALKKQQLASLHSDHAKVMGNLRGKYQILQQTVSEYHTKLGQIIQQANLS